MVKSDDLYTQVRLLVEAVDHIEAELARLASIVIAPPLVKLPPPQTHRDRNMDKRPQHDRINMGNPKRPRSING